MAKRKVARSTPEPPHVVTRAMAAAAKKKKSKAPRKKKSPKVRKLPRINILSVSEMQHRNPVTLRKLDGCKKKGYQYHYNFETGRVRCKKYATMCPPGYIHDPRKGHYKCRALITYLRKIAEQYKDITRRSRRILKRLHATGGVRVSASKRARVAHRKKHSSGSKGSKGKKGKGKKKPTKKARKSPTKKARKSPTKKKASPKPASPVASFLASLGLGRPQRARKASGFYKGMAKR